MESVSWEYKTLVNELTQGMEKAKELRFHLYSASPSQAHDLLLQRILSSYEKALLILRWTGSEGQAQAASGLTSGVPESSISVDGSPRIEELNKNFRDHQGNREISKKRKLQTTWTEQVRVNSENGLEGPTDDGYSWRKYGQKDILGAKYPRSYYRCTYRLVQNCWATKQVQRSDDDPTIFEVTYKGTHTCNQATNGVQPPEKQESNHNDIPSHPQEQQNQALMNLKTNLRVNSEDLDPKEIPAHFSFPSTFPCHDRESQYFPVSSFVDGNLLGAYTPLFYSPAASESNHFTPPIYQMNLGDAPTFPHSETDVADIISAHASTTNSPIAGMEFPIDPVDLDPNFPFNIPGFFT